MTPRPALLLAAASVTALVVAAPVSQAKTTKSPKAKVLRVLVSNDDGVKAPGIDALVKGLRKLSKVEVTVVAPEISSRPAS